MIQPETSEILIFTKEVRTKIMVIKGKCIQVGDDEWDIEKQALIQFDLEYTPPPQGEYAKLHIPMAKLCNLFLEYYLLGVQIIGDGQI